VFFNEVFTPFGKFLENELDRITGKLIHQKIMKIFLPKNGLYEFSSKTV